MKILLVHGIGRSDNNPSYYQPWEDAIAAAFKNAGNTTAPTFAEFHYDDQFEKYDSGPGAYAEAVVKLLGNAAVHSVTDPLGNLADAVFHPGSRGFSEISQSVRWHAGMVAQFAIEDKLRKDLRDLLFTMLSAEQPQLIVAHSLGSLLTYDFLINDSRASGFKNLYLLTLGSQINSPFVRSTLWPGRIIMPKVKYWHHLFNPKDPVFTADISLPPNFYSIQTESASGHSPISTSSGPGYLDHRNTQRFFWDLMAKTGATREFKASNAITDRALEKPKRRALLIGINDYPDLENRLEGCVNDVFLFSSVLQERGFDPEDIRVVLNERATAAGIRERLAWLLEGAGDGMERVLFYSGHGAQMPGYNAAEIVDHVDECLVPYDFNWSKETAITDDDFYKLYSDLPFTARFYAVFDCCHSGGITRDGSRKARGIAPPDDIRHRMLKWNSKEQMWQERDWSEGDKLNSNYGGTAEERRNMMGTNGVTYRLGTAMKLRANLSKADSKKLVKEHRGLYMPVLLEACGEGQLSYEYRHGTVSYGAFTFAMTKHLRATPGITFSKLMAATTTTLKSLGYDQTPQLVAPTAIKTKSVP